MRSEAEIRKELRFRRLLALGGEDTRRKLEAAGEPSRHLEAVLTIHDHDIQLLGWVLGEIDEIDPIY